MPKDTTTLPADPANLQNYKVTDPEQFTRNMLLLLEEGGKMMSGMLAKSSSNGGGPLAGSNDLSEAARAFSEVATHWMADPAKLAEAQGALMSGYMELWNNSVKRLVGGQVTPVAEPEPGDNRFKDPEWSANPMFDFWKQAYLLSSRWAENMVEHTAGLDERTKQRAEFYLRQYSSAMSPSNFPFTNPEVLRETLQSNAQNLVTGLKHLSEDMAKGGDLIKISQTDLESFEVGRNLAVTPGKVVFQNELLQLIQYSPTTEKVFGTPLLIVPPWINKFYILDLTAKKSFIKYIVEQGFTVFVVSWVNPDGRLAHKTFEDYMKEGLLAATDAVTRETGVKKPHVLGYCVAGTLLASTLAYLAGRGEDRFESATFLTAQIDFTKAGDLLIFIDEPQLKALEQMMAERGFLDGSRMASVFNMLRPQDLIWPYIVNNYLLGKKPFPFDLLFWNQDSTRMPAANHSWYLREFYLENKLAKGQMTLGGVRLDMSKVKLPVYELAAREDHIAPLKSVYIGARMFGGPVTMVVSGSGHIAGVVNPPDPARPKYQYWTDGGDAASIDDWLARAKETPGSWWPHWTKWLGDRSHDWLPAREPGAKLGVIEDAPGSYVRTKG